METLAETLRAYRKKHKLTRRQLATHISHLPLRTLEKWETGKKAPPEWALQLIRNHLENSDPPAREMTRYQYKKTAAAVADQIACSYKLQNALIERAHEISVSEQ